MTRDKELANKEKIIEEILKKEIFDVYDMMVICRVGKQKAYRIIREVKSVSDSFRLAGKIHKKDYEFYCSRYQVRV